MAEPGAAHLSIGEVLGLLLEEFPDVTISKIRFLESQGLIEPERTPSGYRKFFDDDVELLRVILREQREKFLPLRVIKDRIDSGQIEKPDPTPPRGMPAEQPTAAHVAKHPAAGATTDVASGAAARGTRPRRRGTAGAAAPRRRRRPHRPASPAPGCCPACSSTARSCARWRRSPATSSPSSRSTASSPKRSGGDLYGDEAVEIAAAAGGFLRAGVDARHLRAWRTSVEREAGLYEQLDRADAAPAQPAGPGAGGDPPRRARRARRPAAGGDDARRAAPVPRLTAHRRTACRAVAGRIPSAAPTAVGVQSTMWCRWSSSGSASRCRRTRRWSCCGSRPGATACCRSTSARPRRRRSTTPSRA